MILVDVLSVLQLSWKAYFYIKLRYKFWCIITKVNDCLQLIKRCKVSKRTDLSDCNGLTFIVFLRFLSSVVENDVPLTWSSSWRIREKSWWLYPLSIWILRLSKFYWRIYSHFYWIASIWRLFLWKFTSCKIEDTHLKSFKPL